GDVVVLEGGGVVTADLRLLEASNLACDESTLTGESVPVTKRVEPVAPDAPVAERASLAFKGTTVVRGAGEAVVVATGTATELGRIASLVEEAGAEPSPLERRLERLGGQLVRGARVQGGEGRRARGRGGARGAADRRDGGARPGDVADGAPERSRDAPAGGGDARRDDRDPHRQDRHAHREPDG